MIYPYMLNNLWVPPNCRIVKSFALFSIENSNPKIRNYHPIHD